MPFSTYRDQFTKEAIRQRMLQHVMHIWGVRSLSHLDPFVRLLMDTLANELNKISNEYLDSEVGLLNKLASLLTPDLLTVPRPAYAIMQAQPAEAVGYLLPDHHFYTSKRFASKPYGELDSRQDIFFSPAGTVKLVDGAVQYIAAADCLFKNDPEVGKMLLARSGAGRQRLPAHTLWLGLRLTTDLTTLDRLTFYLNWPDHTGPVRTDTVYDLLALSHWYINGQRVMSEAGFCYDPAPNLVTPGMEIPGVEVAGTSSFDHRPMADQPDRLLAPFEVDQLLEMDVKRTYHSRFIHLRQPPDDQSDQINAARQMYPAAFANCFPPETLMALNDPTIVWLSVTLPALFDEDTLRTVEVCLNAFPVMNRKLNRLTYRTRIVHNILPLPVLPNETFLAVRSLIDSRNRVFTPFPFRQADRLPTGCYALRRGGVERFDARDAREHLHYLLEVLRDESVAFTAYGQDAVLLHARDLNERLTQLEMLLNQQEGTARELPHYLLVQPQEEGDTLEVSYWTIDGEPANNIPAGTALLPHNMADLLVDHCRLLTATLGGRSQLKAANQLDAYRYALMSRDRVVTLEDIRSFIKAELADLLADVSIRKGVAVGTQPKEGLLRTIDLYLTPAANCQLTLSDWHVLNTSLKAKLISRSGQVNQYRFFVTEPAAAQ
ncbi:type VI secretion system baseplate subunit TssF [Fibrella sp. USSR17]